MNSGSIFFWFKKEKMGSFCPNLLLHDCHFSFPSMLTLLWPLQAIQRCKKKKKKWQCWDSCWFLTHCPSGYTGHVNTERPSSLQTETTEVRVFVKGTFGRSQECGAHSGFLDQISVYSHFLSVSAQTRVRSGGYLRLTFVVWQVLMSFFCLITSRSGRYGGRMLPWREREIRHYDNNHDNNNI